jgi:hypothetical protein
MPCIASELLHEVLSLYNEVDERMGAMERRLFHIHCTLFSMFASGLAVLYGSEEVSSDPYVPGHGSILLRVAYLLRKVGPLPEIQAWIAAGRIAFDGSLDEEE